MISASHGARQLVDGDFARRWQWRLLLQCPTQYPADERRGGTYGGQRLAELQASTTMCRAS
jgi:hypothetical protein